MCHPILPLLNLLCYEIASNQYYGRNSDEVTFALLEPHQTTRCDVTHE